MQSRMYSFDANLLLNVSKRSERLDAVCFLLYDG